MLEEAHAVTNRRLASRSDIGQRYGWPVYATVLGSMTEATTAVTRETKHAVSDFIEELASV